ncbi:hypothetical protein [Deinococcus sp.]|uniref:hypothetical protein n=1 Tax=Deinococcus sp. TaxID=47478 RepID=UPI003C7E20EA
MRLILIFALVSVVTVSVWLAFKGLLLLHLPLILLTLLASLVLVPLAVYAALWLVGVLFHNDTSPNPALVLMGLTALIGVACLVYGARLPGAGAVVFLSVGVVSLLTPLFVFSLAF